MKLEQEVLEAIRNDNVRLFLIKLTMLIRGNKGIDINHRPNANACTYLHEAVASGSVRIFKNIIHNPKLKFNLTADYEGYHGITVFHLAAIKGNEEIFTLLMRNNKIKINAGSAKGRTALHYLAIKGHKKLLKSFLSQMFLEIEVTIKDGDDKKAWEYLQQDNDEDKKLIALLKRAEDKALNIKNLVRVAKVGGNRGENYMVAGQYFAAIECFNLAIEQYREAMEFLPEFTQPIFTEILNLYFLRAKTNFYAGEIDMAIQDYLHVDTHRKKYSDSSDGLSGGKFIYYMTIDANLKISISRKKYTNSSDILAVRKFIYFYLWEAYTKLKDKNMARKYYEKSISQIGEEKLAFIKKKYRTRVEKFCEDLSEGSEADIDFWYSTDDNNKTELLWYFAQKDKISYFEIVKLFLRMNVIPNPVILEDACEAVKALFSYRPSKHNASFPTIYEYCRLDMAYRSFEEELNPWLVDYENTSDEDSSDSEEDTFRVVNKDLLKKNYPHQFARGVHYSPDYYDTQDRNDFKYPESHKETVYSRAISELADKLEKKSDDTLDFEHADELVKSYFEMLKITSDKTEYDENHKAKNRKIDGETAKFESLYHHFIHVYVNRNGYNTLFNKGGMANDFNFCSNGNPTLSVTRNIEVAFRYGSGERINHTSRFFGKLRRSTGAFKHRHLGFVQFYLVSSDYYKKHAADVDKLSKAKKISIAHNYRFNQEVLFESSIPAEYVLGYQIFSLPSFRSDWSEDTQRKYGLNKTDYEKCRKSLLDAAENFQTDEIEKIIKKLIEDITKHQATKLVKSLDQLQKFSSEDEYDFSVEDDREMSERMSKMGIKDSKEEILNSEGYESESSGSQNRP